MSEQIVFGTNDFAVNPDPRVACVLLLDVSGSMAGIPISELNAGLLAYREALLGDPLAARRVEVAIVTFGGRVQTVADFTTVEGFSPPTLAATGDTPMGAAIIQGLEMLRGRKEKYKSNGVSCYRPWVFLVTDGAPTDNWEQAAQQVRQGEADKAFSFFAVAVAGANLAILKQISVREPVSLQGLNFREMFLWLSASQKAVSRSSPGTEVGLPPPKGWASV
jgi:uncharacterized protein YegL